MITVPCFKEPMMRHCFCNIDHSFEERFACINPDTVKPVFNHNIPQKMSLQLGQMSPEICGSFLNMGNVEHRSQKMSFGHIYNKVSSHRVSLEDRFYHMPTAVKRFSVLSITIPVSWHHSSWMFPW